MKSNLGMSLSQVVRVERDLLGKHWNKKLSPHAENPYPLAPKDLVRMGLITPENYNSENEKLSSYCNTMMEDELNRLSGEPEFAKIVRPEIKVFGIGLARDLGWIDKAIYLGFYTTIYDVSSVACQSMLYLAKGFVTKDFVAEDAPDNRLEVVTGEIEEEWESIQSGHTLIIYASQFFQVQKKIKMRRIMRKSVSLVVNSTLEIKPSLYLAHPFKKDNDGSCEWRGISFPTVEWGDTTPYSDGELRAGMGRLRHSMRMDLLGVHMYYHQKYSLLKIRYAAKG